MLSSCCSASSSVHTPTIGAEQEAVSLKYRVFIWSECITPRMSLFALQENTLMTVTKQLLLPSFQSFIMTTDFPPGLYCGPHNSVCVFLLQDSDCAFSSWKNVFFCPLDLLFIGFYEKNLSFKAQFKWQIILKAIYDYLKHDYYLILQENF